MLQYSNLVYIQGGQFLPGAGAYSAAAYLVGELVSYKDIKLHTSNLVNRLWAWAGHNGVGPIAGCTACHASNGTRKLHRIVPKVREQLPTGTVYLCIDRLCLLETGCPQFPRKSIGRIVIDTNQLVSKFITFFILLNALKRLINNRKTASLHRKSAPAHENIALTSSRYNNFSPSVRKGVGKVGTNFLYSYFILIRLIQRSACCEFRLGCLC